MNFSEALSYLLSLGHETLAIKLGLANTETLLQALGNPQQSFRAVQIAGTNGKGSTSVMLAAICRAAGIRAGLFVSPHLISITERISINGEPISQGEFARLTSVVQETTSGLVGQGKLTTPPTFFEHVTAIALLAFQAAKVELAILETGLGGRLDSTTAARADVVAITQVAMDHEEYLGNTLAEIAAEKAAIIRPGVTAIIAPQDEAALAIINRQGKSCGVDPRFVNTDSVQVHEATEDGRFWVTFSTTNDVYENVLLGLRGRHQILNAAVAVVLAESLVAQGFKISHRAIVRGLENAIHRGRLEMLAGPPKILFDGAHNPASALALRAYLDEFVNQKVIMIFGAMRDKRLDEMTATLFPKADEIILTSLDNPRAASAKALISVAPANIEHQKIRLASAPAEAFKMALESATEEDLICITGSLYLIGAIQEIIERRMSASEESAQITTHV